ncbi:hypothetical protein [Rhizobium leguminosarum]
MINQTAYHPRRFQILVGRTLRREFELKLETMRLMKAHGQHQRPVIRAELMAREFGAMASAGIVACQRREAALAAMVQDWREWGELTFDISDTLSTKPHVDEDVFPSMDDLPRSFFVHFGVQRELAIAGGGFVDGVYVSTYPDHGPGYLQFSFVSAPNADSPVDSLGDILSVQSRAAIGFWAREEISNVVGVLGELDIDDKLRPLIFSASSCLGSAPPFPWSLKLG